VTVRILYVYRYLENTNITVFLNVNEKKGNNFFKNQP